MKNTRRRALVFVVPLIVTVVAASRAGEHMRTVDFLQVFGAGMLMGVSVMGLVQIFKKPNTTS